MELVKIHHPSPQKLAVFPSAQSLLNPFYVLAIYFLKIYFNIILPSGPLPRGFPTKLLNLFFLP
jgi:hypothetical protein